MNSEPETQKPKLSPGGLVPAIVREVLRSPGQPLDRETSAFMEPRFGHDFSSVRIHADARAAESARAVNAVAYAIGNDIVFGENRYPPGGTGSKLLAHELAHVIQQEGANFDPVAGPRLAPPEDRFEAQADAAAEAVKRGDNARDTAWTGKLAVPSLQRKVSVDGTAPEASQTAFTEEQVPAGKKECAGWLRDPESIAKRAAEHYVKTELARPLGHVERIECDKPIATGAFGCTVRFSERKDTPIRVLVRADLIIVGVGERITTESPPPDRPLCFYNFHCPPPLSDLVLTKRECKFAGKKTP